MKTIVLYIVFIFSLCSSQLFGQRTPVFSEYNYNPVILNPAHAGFYSGTALTLSNRSTLNQIDGGINNIAFTINSPLGTRKLGLAAGVVRDEIGVTSTTTVFGSYAYKIHFEEGLNPFSSYKNKEFYSKYSRKGRFWDYNPSVLSFGLTAGVSFYNEDLLSLDIQNDPNFEANVNTSVPTFGFGMLYNRRHIYLGLSIPNLVGTRFASNDNIEIESPIYGYFGYRFFLKGLSNIQFKPNGLLKYADNVPVQVDLNMAVNYANVLEIAVGYRTTSSVNFLIGLSGKSSWRVFYSYNHSIIDSPIRGTHGLLLNLQMGKGG